jgi:hypothetical protein
MVLAKGRVFGISSVGASGAAAIVRTELFLREICGSQQTTVYWCVPPCSLVDRYQRFEWLADSIFSIEDSTLKMVEAGSTPSYDLGERIVDSLFIN